MLVVISGRADGVRACKSADLADGVDLSNDELNMGNDDNLDDKTVVVVDGVEPVVVLDDVYVGDDEPDDDGVTVEKGKLDDDSIELINGDVSGERISEVA